MTTGAGAVSVHGVADAVVLAHAVVMHAVVVAVVIGVVVIAVYFLSFFAFLAAFF